MYQKRRVIVTVNDLGLAVPRIRKLLSDVEVDEFLGIVMGCATTEASAELLAELRRLEGVENAEIELLVEIAPPESDKQ